MGCCSSRKLIASSSPAISGQEYIEEEAQSVSYSQIKDQAKTDSPKVESKDNQISEAFSPTEESNSVTLSPKVNSEDSQKSASVSPEADPEDSQKSASVSPEADPEDSQKSATVSPKVESEDIQKSATTSPTVELNEKSKSSTVWPKVESKENSKKDNYLQKISPKSSSTQTTISSESRDEAKPLASNTTNDLLNVKTDPNLCHKTDSVSVPKTNTLFEFDSWSISSVSSKISTTSEVLGLSPEISSDSIWQCISDSSSTSPAI